MHFANLLLFFNGFSMNHTLLLSSVPVKKFISRFGYIEEQAKEMGKSVKELTLGEMEELWQKAKKVRKQ